MLTVMTTRFRTMDQVRAFLEGTEDVELPVPTPFPTEAPQAPGMPGTEETLQPTDAPPQSQQ